MTAESDTIERPQQTASHDDPSVEAYLGLLSKDVDRGTLGRFRRATVARWWALVAHVRIDREKDRIHGDVGL